MTAALKVLNPGTCATIQDLGRFGQNHLGLTTGGSHDPYAFKLANALASFSTATLQFPPFYPFALSYEPQTIVFAVYMRVPPLLFFHETYNALTSSTH